MLLLILRCAALFPSFASITRSLWLGYLLPCYVSFMRPAPCAIRYAAYSLSPPAPNVVGHGLHATGCTPSPPSHLIPRPCAKKQKENTLSLYVIKSLDSLHRPYHHVGYRITPPLHTIFLPHDACVRSTRLSLSHRRPSHTHNTARHYVTIR